MRKLKLYWVTTKADQFDCRFVIAKTPIAARGLIGDGSPEYCDAELVVTLPDAFQDPTVVFVGGGGSAGRYAKLASIEVIRACGIEVVHDTPPRVFVRGMRVFTEGVYDLVRGRSTPDEIERLLTGRPDPNAN